MGTTRPYWSAGLVVLSATLAGCREELGPVPLATTRVRGVIREGGRPVTGGWVEFAPVDGTVGNLRVAPIAGDGQFDASQVAVGSNAIAVVHAPIRTNEVRWLLGARGKPIRRVIAPGPSTTLTIDLLAEAYRQGREESDKTTGHPRSQPVAEPAP
jgi:hypothetical protein